MTGNAEAWGLPNVLDFFTTNRATTADVYPSELIFLKPRLTENMSVLDIGCALAGFAGILGEHLTKFSYTGIDINAEMIRRAETKYPMHSFHHVPEGDFSALAGKRFDLVLVLGILHLHEGWRETLSAAWELTGEHLIFDLRETHGPSVEGKSKSFFRMDFNGGGETHERARLPYNIINAGEAQKAAIDLCPGAAHISHFGYLHAVSEAARTPVDRVMANTYCVERGRSRK